MPDKPRKPATKASAASPKPKTPKPSLATEVANLRREVDELKARLLDLSPLADQSIAQAEPAPVITDTEPEAVLSAEDAIPTDPAELQAELDTLAVPEDEPDWATNHEEVEPSEMPWEGAEAPEDLKIEVRRFNESEGLGSDDVALDSSTVQDMQGPHVGVAMDDDEIAALIAEAEAIAKAELAAKAEREAQEAAEPGEEAEDSGESEVIAEESTEKESGDFETKEFVPIQTGEVVSFALSDLSIPSPETLATLPTDLVVGAMACPRLSPDGELVFLVATPVDQDGLLALSTAIGGPVKQVHESLPVVLAEIRKTYQGAGATAGKPILTTVLGMVKSIFKRAA